MKCEDCQGTGLENENKVCPNCMGLGKLGSDEMVNTDINIKHVITEEEVKDNNLEGKVEAGETIIIPKVKKSNKK